MHSKFTRTTEEDATGKAQDVARATGLSVEEIEDALIISDAKTVAEARAEYETAPGGSPHEAAVIERWNELSLKELETANSYEEVLRVYDDAPGGTEATFKAFRKWLSLCTTARQAMSVYFVTSTMSENSEVRRLAVRRVYELSCAEGFNPIRY